MMYCNHAHIMVPHMTTVLWRWEQSGPRNSRTNRLSPPPIDGRMCSAASMLRPTLNAALDSHHMRQSVTLGQLLSVQQHDVDQGGCRGGRTVSIRGNRIHRRSALALDLVLVHWMSGLQPRAYRALGYPAVCAHTLHAQVSAVDVLRPRAPRMVVGNSGYGRQAVCRHGYGRSQQLVGSCAELVDRLRVLRPSLRSSSGSTMAGDAVH